MIDSEEFIAFNFQIFSRIIPFQLTMKGVQRNPVLSLGSTVAQAFISAFAIALPHSHAKWLFLFVQVLEEGGYLFAEEY